MNLKRHIYKPFLWGTLIILLWGCAKSLHISHVKLFLISKNGDRVPSLLFKHKVENYFEKWYSESRPISNDELINLDSLSRLGYEVYECLMSDSDLLKKLYIDKKYEYVLVPNKIKIILKSRSNLDSCFNSYSFQESKNDVYSTIDLNNFRPNIKNHKCLYFTDEYRKHFYRFSSRYGVKPYILIDSPLMHGGDRFFETSPLVNEVNIYKNSDIVSIVYSIQTSDFESYFKYENNKLIFIKHRYEMAVD
jgi:hypothetical protein